jgi:hypothetical protein
MSVSSGCREKRPRSTGTGTVWRPLGFRIVSVEWAPRSGSTKPSIWELSSGSGPTMT